MCAALHIRLLLPSVEQVETDGEAQSRGTSPVPAGVTVGVSSVGGSVRELELLSK